MTKFTFEKIATTKSGLPGQSKKDVAALAVTVNGQPLSVTDWDNKSLRAEMQSAALEAGHAIVSIASSVQESKNEGPFLTATPA